MVPAGLRWFALRPVSGARRVFLLPQGVGKALFRLSWRWFCQHRLRKPTCALVERSSGARGFFGSLNLAFLGSRSAALGCPGASPQLLLGRLGALLGSSWAPWAPSLGPLGADFLQLCVCKLLHALLGGTRRFSGLRLGPCGLPRRSLATPWASPGLRLSSLGVFSGFAWALEALVFSNFAFASLLALT